MPESAELRDSATHSFDTATLKLQTYKLRRLASSTWTFLFYLVREADLILVFDFRSKALRILIYRLSTVIPRPYFGGVNDTVQKLNCVLTSQQLLCCECPRQLALDLLSLLQYRRVTNPYVVP